MTPTSGPAGPRARRPPGRVGRCRLAAAALALAVVGAGCTSGGERPADSGRSPSATAGSPTAGLALPGAAATVDTFYRQRLSWTGCSAGFQCARLSVPLDYRRPAGGTFSLPLVRLPAGRRTRVIGSLVVNPGGPGVSGVEYARRARDLFPADIRDRFAIVGFDPRGVAGSRPAISCLPDDRLDALVHLAPVPRTAAEVDRLVTAGRELAAGCRARSGALLAHVGTADVARDLDVLRAALGDRRLTYLGASYGTLIGATYAEQFPTHIRALVLDGAVDPELSANSLNAQQAAGFEADLHDFAVSCAGQPACPGSNSTDALESIRALLRQVAQHPLPARDVSADRTVGPAEAFNGIAQALYSPALWPFLEQALRDARAGDGSRLLQLSDLLVERNQQGHYSNEVVANIAVNCVDRPSPRDVAAYSVAADAAARAAPDFGAALAWQTLPCAFWPVPPSSRPHRITAAGAPPILVLGTTRDPATPYAWAVALAGGLSSGRLLTREGDGHTAFRRGSACIDGAVASYLIDLRLPASGTRCR